MPCGVPRPQCLLLLSRNFERSAEGEWYEKLLCSNSLNTLRLVDIGRYFIKTFLIDFRGCNPRSCFIKFHLTTFLWSVLRLLFIAESTHCDIVTSCMAWGYMVIVGSGNDLVHVRYQAINCTNGDSLSTVRSPTNFPKIGIKTQKFPLKKISLKCRQRNELVLAIGIWDKKQNKGNTVVNLAICHRYHKNILSTHNLEIDTHIVIKHICTFFQISDAHLHGALKFWAIIWQNTTLFIYVSHHGPLTKYVKLWVARAPGIPGMFHTPPPPPPPPPTTTTTTTHPPTGLKGKR